jgi:DNA-binding response OmpR family regulator
VKPTIYLFEDDPEIQNLVKLVLSKEFDLHIFGTVAEGKAQMDRKAPDYLILDINLPDGNGIELCKKLVDEGHDQIPILVLTSEKDLSPKLMAFNAGASDYLSKPFEPLELQARVSAHLRRISPSNEQKLSFRLGNILIELGQTKSFYLNGPDTQEDLNLTLLEFKILHLLAKNPSQMFNREQIINSVWGEDCHILDRTVDQHVYMLRKKLKPTNIKIISKRQLGYCIEIGQADLSLIA